MLTITITWAYNGDRDSPFGFAESGTPAYLSEGGCSFLH